MFLQSISSRIVSNLLPYPKLSLVQKTFFSNKIKTEAYNLCLY